VKLASRPRRDSTGTPPPALATIRESIPAILASRMDPFRGGNSSVADQHSFDVVSEINHAEMHNAIVQAQHEIAVRFDFKGTRASIEFNKKENTITLLADHKGQLDTVIQIVKEKMARRSVPVGALRRGKVEDATHDTVRETLTLHSGIETDDARKMIKDIKQLKLKVQAQIMEDKIRVTGKKIDDLQAVIAHLKSHGPEYPLQFKNLA
jgi:cyclic-di-GMP-binding protein